MRKPALISILLVLLISFVPGVARKSLGSGKGKSGLGQRSSMTIVHRGQDLQAALNSAAPGDTLALEAGATFVGNFALPAVSGSNDWITITSTSPNLPGPGVRVTQADADWMPKIVSPNGVAAISTVPGCRSFRFVGIEFSIAADVSYNGGLVLLGDGSQSQNDLALVPHDFVLDRCYIHGNPMTNAKRGVALNCASATIENSYISDFHAVGIDSQAIAGWNGPGPFTISNNYIEASGENLMFGGADPFIPKLIPSDIVISLNSFSKPMAWRDPLLPSVTGVQSIGSTQPNGSLSPGATYYYRIVASTSIGPDVPVESEPSDEVSVLLSPGQNAATISWAPTPGATGYIVYRTADSPSTSTRSWSHYTVSAAQFDDEGGNADAGSAAPPNSGTTWSVKNLLELKNASRVKIKGNIFENNWLNAQTGYAILFKSVNQDGTAPWSCTSNVKFIDNVVRNVASAINIQGEDPHYPSGHTHSILIQNNLFYGVDGPALGGEGTFLKINDSQGIVIDHNTIIQTGNVITAYGSGTADFSFTNNISPTNTYGIKGDGTASGAASLNAYFPAPTCQSNVLTGVSVAAYPPDNYYPATLADVGFVDLQNNNFRLSVSSPFRGAGTQHTNVGADVDRLERLAGPF